LGTSPPRDRDRQAIDLVRALRYEIGRRIARRGIITATLVASPFVDPADRPSALVRMDACATCALLLDLDDPHPASESTQSL
jgi:hypothetical protein